METNKCTYDIGWKLRRRTLLNGKGNSEDNIKADIKGISWEIAALIRSAQVMLDDIEL
jgi:hypothetical protein